MSRAATVTDADLARAREDLAFRHQLLANNLDVLIDQLKRMRDLEGDANSARQLREGVNLAVRLAELLQRLERERVAAGDFG
jgi:hypothetical protein